MVNDLICIFAIVGVIAICWLFVILCTRYK